MAAKFGVHQFGSLLADKMVRQLSVRLDNEVGFNYANY